MKWWTKLNYNLIRKEVRELESKLRSAKKVEENWKKKDGGN